MSEVSDKVDAAIASARQAADHESLSGKVHDFWDSLRHVMLHLSGEKMPKSPKEADPVPIAALPAPAKDAPTHE